MMARLRDGWERFLLYLPLAFMVALALATYWLVRTTPPPSVPAPERLQGHDPDYFMEGFSLKTYDASGRMRSEIRGDRARHFPDSKGLEIDGIRIRTLDEAGRWTTATAQRGLTNEDGSEVQLLGNAVVIRDVPSNAKDAQAVRMEYRSDYLHAFMDTQTVRSHKPVELYRGRDRLSADNMDYDHVHQLLQMQGRVRGTLYPGKK